jgi:hypothetical protein
MRNPRDLTRRLDALEGTGDADCGPRVLLILPDDGSGSPGFDGDGIDPPTRIGPRHRRGWVELHVFDFGTGACGFLDAAGSRCSENHADGDPAREVIRPGGPEDQPVGIGPREVE